MKVWVDHDVCTGDGLCEETAASVFQLVDGISFVRDGHGALLHSGVAADVPEWCLDAVLDAAEQCPGECIFIDV